MKILEKFIKIITYLAILSLIIYITLIKLVPEKVNNIINYKFYTVLTNSMEPTIPTYSLVCVKKFKEDKVLNLNSQQIITFNANRFGKNIIITHHFNKTEIDENGDIVYRTNAEGSEDLDMYKTKRNDLIGTYIFHIPFIGKFILFLKSKFSFILYGELATIFLINNLIRARWEEKLDDLTNGPSKKTL